MTLTPCVALCTVCAARLRDLDSWMLRALVARKWKPHQTFALVAAKFGGGCRDLQNLDVDVDVDVDVDLDDAPILESPIVYKPLL
jgi:hypothetical protein